MLDNPFKLLGHTANINGSIGITLFSASEDLINLNFSSDKVTGSYGMAIQVHIRVRNIIQIHHFYLILFAIIVTIYVYFRRNN